MDPLFDIFCSLHHKNPLHCIPLRETVKAFTINGARAAFEEDEKGTITQGKLADLVVLSANPLRVPVDRIRDIKVCHTIVGGRFVYSAPGEIREIPGKIHLRE